MGNVLLPPIRKNETTSDLSGKITLLNAQCRNCKPITPFQCLSGCRMYTLKSELRQLWEAIDNPNYIKELFNAIKNVKRLHVMQVLANDTFSLSVLQQNLKKAGYSYRQDLLSEECLPALKDVGLVSTVRDGYRATTLGVSLTRLIGAFLEFADRLPSHSECYEEALLQSLLSGPKTFEDIEALIAPKNVSRTLKRLSTTSLIETPSARAYIFFFKTIRDPDKETLTDTERKTYDVIANQKQLGIAAGDLAKQTGLILRRIYKIIKALKGKKLVFLRRTPKTYALTAEGKKLALILQELEQTVEDTLNSTQEVMMDNQIILESGGSSNRATMR
ncbi:MAG: hypothetical protein ACM3UN_04320 [Bacillota bacterium]